MNRSNKIPARTIERAVLYKRLLSDALSSGEKTIYSHQLAEMARNTPAQVRRDIMTLGYEGCPHKGYHIAELIQCITNLLDGDRERLVALVGIGNLGRAILSYFTYRHPGVTVAAAFDMDESKVNRVIAGCRCYHVNEFESKVRELGIRVGIITVPASHAQKVADMMVKSGICGILNFAPVPLNLPENVSAERIDIATTIEKIAYFADSGR